MKNKLFLLALLTFVMVSCGNNTQTDNHKTLETSTNKGVTATNDDSIVNVYYFYGKQRCKTCLAIESVAKQAVETNYEENPKVRFVEVNIDDEKNQALVEKYEVSFSSLIIAKGDHHTNLTEQAFADAVDSPDALVNLLKDEIKKQL